MDTDYSEIRAEQLAPGDHYFDAWGRLRLVREVHRATSGLAVVHGGGSSFLDNEREVTALRRLIIHLCADTGSDSWAYRSDPRYRVETVGKDIGVENYHATERVWGAFANPVCTEFTPATYGNAFGGGERRPRDLEQGMFLVRHCQRIIREARPQWWVIENPARGRLRDYLGAPDYSYEPWHYGSPWTKRTGLWGSFNAPPRVYDRWEDVPKLDLYVRPGRGKPSLAFAHKSWWDLLPEFRDSGMPRPTTDAEFRSLCSQRFAEAFKRANP